MVTIQDLNWAAGFLEGEGSFGCCAAINPHLNRVSPRLAVEGFIHLMARWRTW